MKYPVYLLLIANIAYLGWNLYLGRTGGEMVRELPPLPTGAAPLVTLQEMREQQEMDPHDPKDPQHADVQTRAEETREVKKLTELQPPGAGISMNCLSIGPFLAMEGLRATADELQGLGIQGTQRSAEQRQPNGYWVYLPSMERKQVLQAVKQLEEKGDREYYVGKGNFIALGTFRERNRAEIRLEQARGYGFDPVLQALYETHTEYWLDIDTQTPVADDIDAIMDGHPELQLQKTVCP